MDTYIFKTSDIAACSDYVDATLVCSPGGCKVTSTSEDGVILYETKVIPMIYGKASSAFKIQNWSAFEDHSVVEVWTAGDFVFDKTLTLNFEPGEELVSRLPGCAVVGKLPEYILKYNAPLTFHKEKGDPAVRIDIKEPRASILMDTIYSDEDDTFSVVVRSEFLHDYVSSGYLKFYFEDNFPVGMEDGCNRTFVAPVCD